MKRHIVRGSSASKDQRIEQPFGLTEKMRASLARSHKVQRGMAGDKTGEVRPSGP